MKEDNSINKIIKKLCKEVFPDDVFQKGNSRVYLDDNGWFFTVIEFQPYTLGKGTFLNAGLSFLFNQQDYLSFSYQIDHDTRIGGRFIQYQDDEQFERDVREYVLLANEYISKYREFADIEYAKKYIVNELDDGNWNPYIKAMLCYLTDDIDNGSEYYQIFINNPWFKKIIDRYGYPTNSDEMDKSYVLEMIKEQRDYWHSRSMMKKMKVFTQYER